MWNKVSEKELPYEDEVIAFNEKWIDEDFNPNGTRIGFLTDDGFVSAKWAMPIDEYKTCREEGDDYFYQMVKSHTSKADEYELVAVPNMPTHWMEIPTHSQ